MGRRLHALCALWLVAQILLPFTAPFPICDLADLLGSTPRHGASLKTVDAPVDGDYACAPPLETTVGRLKLVVASTLEPLHGLSTAPVATTFGRPTGVAFGQQRRAPDIQPTILRL